MLAEYASQFRMASSGVLGLDSIKSTSHVDPLMPYKDVTLKMRRRIPVGKTCMKAVMLA